VVVGNIGSNTRAKYGIVGSNVNLTARIESYTVGGQILISEPTYQAVSSCEIAGSMQVEPKGVTEPITIYEVSGVSKYDLYLSSNEDELRSLTTEVVIEYKVLQEKHLGNDVFKGKVVRLSPNGAEIISDEEIAPMTNIRIIPPLNVEQAKADTGFYAKVLDRNCEAKMAIALPFISTSPPSRRKRRCGWNDCMRKPKKLRLVDLLSRNYSPGTGRNAKGIAMIRIQRSN
jgi:adenylate cyclase